VPLSAMNCLDSPVIQNGMDQAIEVRVELEDGASSQFHLDPGVNCFPRRRGDAQVDAVQVWLDGVLLYRATRAELVAQLPEAREFDRRDWVAQAKGISLELLK
jgi:hypothetical protein